MKPLLVLQMQRMGDLILTFPLIGWLARQYSGHPIWTVAEPRFFDALRALAPQTVFFPPEAAPKMRTTAFHTIINVSHRPDAAAIAGSLTAERYFGTRATPQGDAVHGYFALYRASIVHNNRHNLLHWSDLHLLDHTGAVRVPHQTACALPSRTGERVGLFVGASEAEKRPSAQFFGQLGRILLRKGFKPLFLGGPQDTELGAAAAKEAGVGAAHLCGTLALPEFAEALRTLALCVTPDTGPMHLATWMNVPVLNLSLGPVNPWETGPAAPGHHVLRAHCSCSGCWACHRDTAQCHSVFTPKGVALVIRTLLRDPSRLARLALPGLALYRTVRDDRGLAALQPLSTSRTIQARSLLGTFWREWFLAGAPHFGRAQMSTAASALQAVAPLHQRLLAGTHALGKECARHLSAGAGHPLPEDFWSRSQPLLRPFTSFMQLRLQNSNYSREAWACVLADLEQLSLLLCGENCVIQAQSRR